MLTGLSPLTSGRWSPAHHTRVSRVPCGLRWCQHLLLWCLSLPVPQCPRPSAGPSSAQPPLQSCPHRTCRTPTSPRAGLSPQVSLLCRLQPALPPCLHHCPITRRGPLFRWFPSKSSKQEVRGHQVSSPVICPRPVHTRTCMFTQAGRGCVRHWAQLQLRPEPSSGPGGFPVLWTRGLTLHFILIACGFIYKPGSKNGDSLGFADPFFHPPPKSSFNLL